MILLGISLSITLTPIRAFLTIQQIHKTTSQQIMEKDRKLYQIMQGITAESGRI